MAMRLAFIGLGVMGRPMASHLRCAGHELAVFARRREAMEPLVALGARAGSSPADAAAGADVVFSMVTGGDDVQQIALGERGLVHGAARGSVFVDMSTIAASRARAIASGLDAAGIAMLDAPVSGGERGAREATLSIMVGGDAAVFARVEPLLRLLGRTVVHVGGHGAGQVAKACNQMVLCAAIEAAAEAARLAAANGVDFARVHSALLQGAAGSRALELFGAKMVSRDFSAGVQARLHHKDMGIVLDEAVRLGLPMPVAAGVWQQLNALMAAGWGMDDTSSLLKVGEASPR